MNQEHQPHHMTTYSGGADTDSDKELLGSNPTSGKYIDSRNARPNSTDGNTGSLEKIRGEVLHFPNTTNLAGYKCVGAESVNNDIIEFWAPVTLPGAGIIRVNGIIVCESINFEMRVDFPLQITKNESFTNGEVMITDRRVPPYIFFIKDLVDSLTADPLKYFANFNPLLYQINLQSPLDTVTFVEHINVGGGGGGPVGHYQYQMRYASDEGDRTNWSHPSPMIPIMQSLSSESREYPWVKTYGGPPDPSHVTSFAPKLRFRVTNIYNYDYIEIKRLPYNNGAGIEYTPNGIIVAKIDVTPGEISVREYIDWAESNVNIPLSATAETQELVEVESAGSIRYFDRRLILMNVKLATKEAQLTFKEINGKQGFPVIDKLYREGYNDPWNHVYKDSFMRGEREGFGVNLYDGVGTKGFTTKIPDMKNFQFPNRRDPISTETANYSYGGTARAADSSASNAVSQTHEVFDLGDPVYKNAECEFKNVIHPGRILGLTGTKTTIAVKDDCDETNEEIENHGADVDTGKVSVSYQPFTPVRANDPDVEGHNYVVNTKVSTDDVATGPFTPEGESVYNFRPSGFSPDYYAQGVMIAGVDNFPKWAKSFAIVRTGPANRVLCQGIGYYSLTKGKFKLIGNASLGGKEKNKFWFYSPDIENGIVSSDTMNDVISNPQNYKLQFVSPLGFFSEMYSAEDNLFAGQRDRCIDMISYVRMLRDREADPNNQINPTESADMGVPGGDGFNYIAYDKFRNTGQIPSTFGGDPSKGSRLFSIAQSRRKSDGRGTFIEFETVEDVYGTNSTGGSSNSNFEDGGLKDWTEPIYMINIIREGANIKDQNIQKYKQTAHYQKLESIIGKSKGGSGQFYQLVDERWEDCIPAPTSASYGAGTDRFLYIKNPNGIEEKWINVTYMTTAQASLIASTILSTGSYLTDIKGVYRHRVTDGRQRFFEIIFDYPGFEPIKDALILVKYDNTAPIRVYGGGTYIGETIFAPIDRRASAKDKAAENQFAFGIGLPFKNFKINPRYYTIRKGGAAINAIQDSEWFQLGFIRQLCVMFTVESRAACHLAYNLDYPKQFFPLINYVIRPNRWNIDKSTVDNHLYQDYEDDYGVDEKTQWKWGGFRFLQQINPDYSVEPRIGFFSKPEFGFVERREFRTRVMWSLPRSINVQDSPGLKTFPANNAFDIDDAQGEIKYAYDSTTGRGENLYAITEKGVCMLVTKKSILSDLEGGNIGYMASDTFVKQQLWITKDVGMTDKWWRSVAEGFVPITSGDGPEIRQEAIFFANKESVFMMMENTVQDIGRIGYYSKLFNQGISKVLPGLGTDVMAFYDKFHQEYRLFIGGEVDNMFVFSKLNMMWTGTQDFKFDKIIISGLNPYGMRGMETFKLDVGYTINGQPIIYEALAAAAPEQFWDKEFIRVRVNSPQNQKPTKIEFYKEHNGPIQCSLDPANSAQGSLYMKDYRGFEGFIPRIDGNVNINRPRFQQRLIIYKIIHNLASEFKLIDSSVQYKLLK